MTDLIKDISTITTIPVLTLEKLIDRAQWIICDSIENSLQNKENVVEIDIGLGKLIIKVETDNVFYKFIPSNSFEKDIIDTVVNKKNPLQINAEESLGKKFATIYKEFI